MLEHRERSTGDKETITARRQEYQPGTIYGYGLLFFLAPERGGKSRLGGELRWEDNRLCRTRVCVDREGTVDDMSEAQYLCFARGHFHYRYRGDKVLKTAIPTTSKTAVHIPGPTCSHDPNTQQVDTASRALISCYGALFSVSCYLAKVQNYRWWELKERLSLGGGNMCDAPLHHPLAGSLADTRKKNLQ
jgi:hypothetical protein